MGTKVQNLPGYYSMRDLNEESSSCGWPLFYGDKALANGHYYHNYMSGAAADACSEYDKEAVKQTMLEHEALFKNQVFELHRLYRVQRDLMDEAKTKELHQNQMPAETSFSTGPLASQITSEDGKRWHISGFPVGSPTCARTSISGIEGIHTPLGSIKETSKQACLFPSPNGSSSKDVEVLESRPSKVRRKMFDLHLPANEYIDTEEIEKLSDEKISGTKIFLPNCKQEKEVDLRPFLSNGVKTGSQEDASRSEPFLRSTNFLADLNEPVQVEETYEATCVTSPNHNPYRDAIECSDVSAKQKSRLFGLSREDLINSHRGTDSWARNKGYLDNNGRGKGWISSVLESGQAKSNLQPIPQVLNREHFLLSSQTMKDTVSKAHESSCDYQTYQNKAEFWRGKTVSGLDARERNHEHSTSKHTESVVSSSHRPGFFALAPSSDLSKSCSYSSLELASSNLNQKLVSVQTAPSISASGGLSRNSQSHQSNGILGDSWPISANSKLNPGFQYEVPVKNGFFPGSSARSKELSVNISSISYDYLNHNNDSKRIPEHYNNGSSKYYNSSNSNCNDMMSRKDINLNVILSNGSSNKLVTQSSCLEFRNGEQKHEEQLVLPWLRPKSMCKNEAQNAGRSIAAGESSFFQAASVSNKDETSKGSSGNFLNNVTSGLCSNDIQPRRTEISEGSNKKKILGVPIFDLPHISPKESSSLTSPSLSALNPPEIELVKNNRKNWVLDINMPCDVDVIELDDEAVTEIVVNKKGSPTAEANSRNQIDLNLSISEDEAYVTCIPTTDIKAKAEIDLEAPAVPETEEDAIPEEKQFETPLISPPDTRDTGEQLQDEFIRCAAESIVVMSSVSFSQVDDVIKSPSVSTMVDPLGWFAGVVVPCINDLERKSDNSKGKNGEDNEASSTEEMDYFECMTLKLIETKEEDYMPKPLVPEDFKVEEPITASLPARARKGSARRGRQRRDFQRDILPGLASLSRHEVTEDLQIFGGLMRATGHSWQSGLTRRSSSRNGSGRGRRRVQVAPSPPLPVATIEPSTPLIQQLNAIEVGLEDRSLTGWGKTTRRPRRQRFPAGNPPSIRLI